jgi:hypothetical protein
MLMIEDMRTIRFKFWYPSLFDGIPLPLALRNEECFLEEEIPPCRGHELFEGTPATVRHLSMAHQGCSLLN